jgi:hypothetical protein
MKRGNNNNKNNDDGNNRKRPPPPSPPPLPIGVIACRTRSKKRAIAAKWDMLPIPIIIQIISWLDQDSLMNLSLVSKQCHNIICNEPGNENKIIPVFEVSGSSTRTLFSNLRDYSLNNDTKIKLQRYTHMRINDVRRFVAPNTQVHDIVRNLRMDGILTLDISLQYDVHTPRHANFFFLRLLSKIFPNLKELNSSNVEIDHNSFGDFSKNCPLLEKVTSNNNYRGVCLTRSNMRHSNNLKEINMDNSSFHPPNKIYGDLNNSQGLFLFFDCSKSLERVSIRYMNFYVHRRGDNYGNEESLFFKQNLLIKFVRNAPPSLHWFRSDLTQDNMTMLRLERPGIELLN